MGKSMPCQMPWSNLYSNSLKRKHTNPILASAPQRELKSRGVGTKSIILWRGDNPQNDFISHRLERHNHERNSSISSFYSRRQYRKDLWKSNVFNRDETPLIIMRWRAPFCLLCKWIATSNLHWSEHGSRSTIEGSFWQLSFK